MEGSGETGGGADVANVRPIPAYGKEARASPTVPVRTALATFLGDLGI